MKKINYKIILGILLVVALAGAVLLVQQRQETRRGATSSSGFIRLSLDESSTTKEVTAGQEFAVPLVANVTDAGGVDSVVAYFCYDPTKIELKNVSDLEKSFTRVEPAQYVGGSVKVEESNNKCVKVTFVSIEQGFRMKAQVADINFKAMASSGTGTIAIDKSKSSLGVAGQETVSISSVGNLNYSISGTTGGFWVYKGSSPCQKSSITYETLDACNAADDSKNSCYASQEECNAVTNPNVYCVGTCPAGTAHKTDGVCSNGGTRDDSSCTDVLTSYCGKHYDYNCCTCKTAAVVNGVCGTTVNTCTTGTADGLDNNSTQYKWNCIGTNGGTTASCTKNISTTDAVIKIKMAFAGVKPGNDQCATNIWPVSLRVVDGKSANLIPGMSWTIVTPTKTTEVNNKGEIVYVLSVTIPASSLSSSDSVNSVLMQGPKHIFVKYGKNHQTSYYNDLIGDLAINVGNNDYDFSEYPLLTGDVNSDDKIDSRDWSVVKEKSQPTTTGSQGTDLADDVDGNCQVNAADAGLVKKALMEVNGQTY